MIKNEDINNEIIRGNKKAFKNFFYTFYPVLCLFAQRFISSSDAACDIVQDAFIEYWENRKRFSNIEKAKGYLYTIVKNKCLNYIKHQVIVEKHQKPDPDIDSEKFFFNSMIEEETIHIIHSVISKLPPQSKKIILCCLDKMTNKEIADSLNISINTVKTLKQNSYKFIREKLKNNPFD